MILAMGGAFVVLIGAAMVFGVAEAKQRNGVVWTFADLALAGGGAWLAWQFAAANVHDPDTTAFGLAAPVLVTPIAAHVILALVAYKLPLFPARTRDTTWQMRRMDEPSDDCSLSLTPDGVRISPAASDPIDIAAADFLDVRQDGECVALRWRDGEREAATALYPTQASDREQSIRMAGAIARRIDKHRLARSSREKTPQRVRG